MKIALFDLDNTLIAGDSDAGWGDYLVEQGIVDGASYGQQNQRFFADYKAGKLDIYAYLHFQLNVLAQHPVEQLHRWRAAFVEQKIKPWLLPQGQTLIQQHQNAGAVVAIITATNFFVAEPIAQMMGVPHLIATRPRLEKGRYTGAFDGIPTFAHGKIQAFNHWLAGHQLMASETWFYSDSHNDLPLLQQVDHPIAVDPDPLLQQTAQQNSWPIISLRQ